MSFTSGKTGRAQWDTVTTKAHIPLHMGSAFSGAESSAVEQSAQGDLGGATGLGNPGFALQFYPGIGLPQALIQTRAHPSFFTPPVLHNMFCAFNAEGDLSPYNLYYSSSKDRNRTFAAKGTALSISASAVGGPVSVQMLFSGSGLYGSIAPSIPPIAGNLQGEPYHFAGVRFFNTAGVAVTTGMEGKAFSFTFGSAGMPDKWWGDDGFNGTTLQASDFHMGGTFGRFSLTQNPLATTQFGDDSSSDDEFFQIAIGFVAPGGSVPAIQFGLTCVRDHTAETLNLGANVISRAFKLTGYLDGAGAGHLPLIITSGNPFTGTPGV